MNTSDVYFSAALMSLGFKLVNVDRADPRHMIFSFASASENNLGDRAKSLEKAGFDAIKLQWTNEELQVNAFKFAESIKRLKSIIHSN